jgi:hypothetical protein
VGHS